MSSYKTTYHRDLTIDVIDIDSAEGAAQTIMDIRTAIDELIDAAVEVTEMYVAGNALANLEAYVFAKLREHVKKANPYNQDLKDVAAAIRSSQHDTEM